jgi:hypothetical protein
MYPSMPTILPARLWRPLIAAIACFVLASCSGIPVSSIPRLVQLNNQLLDIKPAEFMIAIQLDARMVPAPGAAPVMDVTLEPKEAGGFEAMNKKLPLRLANFESSAGAPAQLSGLQDAPKSRRWLVYSFTPESQAELQRIQATIKRLMKDRQTNSGPGKGGGKISVGIAQEAMPARDPAFANTRWESWIQTRQSEGFFELWSGTVSALLKQAGPPKP